MNVPLLVVQSGSERFKHLEARFLLTKSPEFSPSKSCEGSHSIAGTAGVVRSRDQNFVSYLQNPTFLRWVTNHQSLSKVMLVTGVDQSSYRDWCRHHPSPKLPGKIIL